MDKMNKVIEICEKIQKGDFDEALLLWKNAEPYPPNSLYIDRNVVYMFCLANGFMHFYLDNIPSDLRRDLMYKLNGWNSAEILRMLKDGYIKDVKYIHEFSGFDAIQLRDYAILAMYHKQFEISRWLSSQLKVPQN